MMVSSCPVKVASFEIGRFDDAAGVKSSTTGAEKNEIVAAAEEMDTGYIPW